MPIGHPGLLNKAGWLDITAENCIRERATQAAFGVLIVPFAADLLDEIDRLRALIRDLEPYDAPNYVLKRIGDALANTKAQN